MTDADVALFDALERAKPKPRQRFGKRVKGGLSERQIQRQIVQALRAMGIFVHHSPNGGHLAGDDNARMRQTAALKADGMVAGWPDLTLIDRDGELALIEVKAPGGALNEAQEALLPKLRARCPRVAVVTSLDEALERLRAWGWVQ